MKQKKVIYLVLLILNTILLQAQLVKIPLEIQIQESDLIVEGKIIDQKGFKTSNNLICTSNTLLVTKFLKGKIAQQKINIITEGGQVENSIQVTSPSTKYIKGANYIVFLVKDKLLSPSQNAYREYAIVQSTFSQDEIKQEFLGVYDRFSENVFYNEIYRKTNQEPIVYKNYKDNSIEKTTPVIASLSPTTITAGTRSVLTITGSGFGTTVGSIAFNNASFGGAATTTVTSPPVISWTDTEIKINVPVFAGTGNVYVNGVDAGIITVPYAINAPGNDLFNPFRPYLADKNTNGGYTWNMNNEFAANSAAKESFMRAFNNVRCTTGANWKIGESTNINTRANDGVNLILFDDDNQTLIGEAGAVCNTYYDVLCGNNAIMSGYDIVFRKNNTFPAPFSWNYGPTGSNTSQYDFETTALHELLHGNGLTHVNDNSDTMFYTRLNGEDQRTISTNSMMGINYINAGIPCGVGAMVPYSCISCGTPVAEFKRENYTTTASSIVCLGSSVKFSDQSFCNNLVSKKLANEDYGTVLYNWTFTNNNGTTYTSSEISPTIVFNMEGSYNATLTVTNAFGTNSVTKTGYIKVVPATTPSNLCTAITSNQYGQSGYSLTVSKVVFNEINNQTSTSVNNVYTNNRCSNNTVVTAGESYPLSITVNALQDTTEYFRVYIDYNNDGLFDNSELIFNGYTPNQTSNTFTNNIVIPTNAVKNTLLTMRVIGNAFAATTETCGDFALADVEDYGVMIIGDAATLSAQQNTITNTKKRIYPNPATNIVNIVGFEKEKISKIQIYDSSGRLIIEKTPVVSSSKITEFSLQNIVKGNYILNVITDKSSETFKLIKE